MELVPYPSSLMAVSLSGSKPAFDVSRPRSTPNGMVMTTRSATTVLVPPAVENVSVYEPSWLSAIAVMRQPVLTGPGRLAAMAFGSCSLPPTMWKRWSDWP